MIVLFQYDINIANMVDWSITEFDTVQQARAIINKYLPKYIEYEEKMKDHLFDNDVSDRIPEKPPVFKIVQEIFYRDGGELLSENITLFDNTGLWKM